MEKKNWQRCQGWENFKSELARYYICTSPDTAVTVTVAIHSLTLYIGPCKIIVYFLIYSDYSHTDNTSTLIVNDIITTRSQWMSLFLMHNA